MFGFSCTPQHNCIAKLVSKQFGILVIRLFLNYILL